MDSSGWDMYVFRDGRRVVAGQRLVSELRDALVSLSDGLSEASHASPSDEAASNGGHAGSNTLAANAKAAFCQARDRLLNALVAAGELECALVDAGSGAAALAATITDEVAGMLVNGVPQTPVSNRNEENSTRGESADPSPWQPGNLDCAVLRKLLAQLKNLRPPDKLRVSVQEGFAYYALHPLKVVDLLDQILQAQGAFAGDAGLLPVTVAVLGIRSIGATLSAVLRASLERRGYAAERITVRPTGHPYDRQLSLDPQQAAWIEARKAAAFLVIDEGPGLSGSSFLAVAEALVAAGIAPGKILLIGSRQPDVKQLRSQRAAERWGHFRFACLPAHPYVPAGASAPASETAWGHNSTGNSTGEVPTAGEEQASWTQLEMARFLSDDAALFYQFEGFGHYGGEIGKRAAALAAADYGPPYLGNEAGFGVYRLCRGRSLARGDRSAVLLQHIAGYCAFRQRQFRADDSQPSDIDEMARWNWSLEFGKAGKHGGQSPELAPVEVTHRVFCDANMMPHQWLAIADGRWLKLDGAARGDNHFFPGPCDIAWDLAGTIVEWELDGPETDYFLAEYRRASGDDAQGRLLAYLRTYAAFRMGWCKMGALASRGGPDDLRLRRNFERYRRYAERLTGAAQAPARVIELEPKAAQPESAA